MRSQGNAVSNGQPLRVDSAALEEGGTNSPADPFPEQLAVADDLSREVFGVLGVPVDVLSLPTLLNEVDAAVTSRTRLLLSTPNVNFLVLSHKGGEVRDSLIFSDLCSADGMPLVWIARLLGVPLSGRVAG